MSVTVIRKENLRQTIAENVIQLHTLAHRRRYWPYEEPDSGHTGNRDDDGEVNVHGLVADGQEWQALEYAMDPTTGN